MKKLLQYFKEYFKTEFHLTLYLVSILFLGACIFLNYHFKIEKDILDGMGHSLWGIPVHFIFYSIPFYFLLISQAYFQKRWTFLNSKTFWFTSIFALLMLSINGWFPYHKDLSHQILPDELYYFGRKIGWNLKSSIFYFFPILFYKLSFDNKQENLYGLTSKNFDPKPYLFLLAFMFPLVLWASFQDDFLRVYPTIRPSMAERYLDVPQWVTFLSYELIYGIDFTFVELFFRGFMVIGFAKWLGKDAILPMVGVYCFLHFGKPMGEAISSIFGGMALGIIAYYSRSIFGGVLIHMGVAWMMDFMAWFQSGHH